MSLLTESYEENKDKPEVQEFISYCKSREFSYEELGCALLGCHNIIASLRLQVEILSLSLQQELPTENKEKLH